MGLVDSSIKALLRLCRLGFVIRMAASCGHAYFKKTFLCVLLFALASNSISHHDKAMASRMRYILNGWCTSTIYTFAHGFLFSWQRFSRSHENPKVSNVYLNKQLQVINENLVSLTKHKRTRFTWYIQRAQQRDGQRCANVCHDLRHRI